MIGGIKPVGMLLRCGSVIWSELFWWLTHNSHSLH